ncbi:hypothetical protein B0H34DRAFT_674239 [Crassisporium funariophilum]|nr:hypothetical protein B0H34DRAFT_674239 [Crassisporium funariophilum]
MCLFNNISFPARSDNRESAFGLLVWSGWSVIINTINPGFTLSNLRKSNNTLANIMNFILEKTLLEQRKRVLGRVALLLNQISRSIFEPANSVLGKEGKRLEDKIWRNGWIGYPQEFLTTRTQYGHL